MTKVGMVSRVLSFGVFALVFSQVPACELTVDTAPLSNKVCPTGQKGCLNQQTNKMECVSADPAHGCAGELCLDCRGLLITGTQTQSHVTTAACAGTAGTCSVNICDDKWGDCNHLDVDGCESDLNNGTFVSLSVVSNCKLCGINCNGIDPATAHGKTICQVGACKYSCDTGWQDCDGIFGGAANGCECDLSTHHCTTTTPKTCVPN
jgi:hypothetical protein